MKTAPDFLAAYKAALAAKRATPKPPEKFVDRPTLPHAFQQSRTVGQCAGCIFPEAHEIHLSFVEHPLCHRWPIEAIKLAPGKARYFVLLRDNYFAEVKECGTPLTTTRHLLSLWKLPPNHPPREPIQTILDTPPLTRIFTLPFIFHDSNQARQALTTTIQTLAADL